VSGPSLRRHPRLVALCVGAAMVETVLVWLLAPHATLALATQGSAPPPFDVFHDVRWLLVYHETWLGFAVELAALLAVRTAFTALVVRAAWPADLPREAVPVTVRRSLWSTAIVVAVLLPCAGVLFAMAVVSLSWLFFVAVPVVVMLALLVHGSAITGDWWRRTLPWRSLAWVLVAFAAITLFGALLVTVAPWARLPVAAVAGVVNAAIWLRLVDAVLHPARPPRRVAVAPIGIALVMSMVVVGTTAGFAIATRGRDQAAAATGPVAPARVASAPIGATGPLFVVTGFNTHWDASPSRFVHLPSAQRRFSYAGTAADGAPIPYARDDTHRSLPALTRELRAQVDVYAAEVGPVTIVAESEGSLLAKAYLAATPDAPVRGLVVLSPLVEPGRVFFPKAGGEGWGAFGGLEIAGLSWALAGVSPVDVGPDTPFLRSLVDHAPALSGLMACRVPGVREADVLPLDTGLSAGPQHLRVPYTVVPALHGGMLDDDVTARVVRRLTSGRPLDEDHGWVLTERVVAASSAAWQVPVLDPAVNDAWSDSGPRGCAGTRAALRRWLG
jgi:hypothetical protein